MCVWRPRKKGSYYCRRMDWRSKETRLEVMERLRFVASLPLCGTSKREGERQEKRHFKTRASLSAVQLLRKIVIVVPALLTKATLVINPLTSSLTLILIMVESMILIYARRQIIRAWTWITS